MHVALDSCCCLFKIQIELFICFYLAWIASKVKAVTPALPAGNVAPSVNDGVPKVAGGSMAVQSGEKQTTKRRRRGSKKTTKAKIVTTTAAPKKDGEGSSNGDDDDDDDNAKTILKRFIRALIK